MVPQPHNSLLNYAISKLSPEIFSHPVWLRFGHGDASGSLRLPEELLTVVESLRAQHPGEACQILLVCALYQNRLGQHINALQTSQRAIALAETNNLVNEWIWALWAACAIAIQQKNYERAEAHFIDLQAALAKQNEWILGNFIEILRQSVVQPAHLNTEKQRQIVNLQRMDDVVAYTFDWLRHWGDPLSSHQAVLIPVSGSMTDQTLLRSVSTQSFIGQHNGNSLKPLLWNQATWQWLSHLYARLRRRLGLLRSLLRVRHLSHIQSEKVESTVVQNIAIPNGSPAKETTHKPGSNHKKDRRARTPDDMAAAVHMLGTFRFSIQDIPLKLPASRSLSVFKYLLLHHKQHIPREVLMNVFWPDADPDLARNNLNVAMHNLRQSLRIAGDMTIIQYEDSAYGLSPDLHVWLDVEEFDRCMKAAQKLEAQNQIAAAVMELETAVSLYQGDFLEQNPYEEWTIFHRERLRVAYLDALDRLSQIYFSQERYTACRTVCQLILTHDRCREEAHCLLMRCYSRQRQYHLGLRQYQICVEALREELQVEPGHETRELYEQIRRREPV